MIFCENEKSSPLRRYLVYIANCQKSTDESCRCSDCFSDAFPLFCIPPDGIGESAGVVPYNKTNHHIVQLLHYGVGDVRIVMRITDTGVVGYENKRSSGIDCTLTSDIFA